MDEQKILDAIAQLQVTLQSDIATLRQDVTLKNQELEKKIQDCEINQAKQDARLNFLEKEYRKKNILIHGIPEEINNKRELETYILNLINRKMEINTTIVEIDGFYRLGPPKDRKNRPVLVKFISRRKIIEILTKTRTLRDTDVYITEDLSKEEQETRKSLVVEMKKHREQGKHAIIRNNRIIIRENEKEERTRKRLPSDEAEDANARSKIIKERKQDHTTKIKIFEKFAQVSSSGSRNGKNNEMETTKPITRRVRSNSIVNYFPTENPETVTKNYI